MENSKDEIPSWKILALERRKKRKKLEAEAKEEEEVAKQDTLKESKDTEFTVRRNTQSVHIRRTRAYEDNTTELQPPAFGFRNHPYVQSRGAKDTEIRVRRNQSALVRKTRAYEDTEVRVRRNHSTLVRKTRAYEVRVRRNQSTLVRKTRAYEDNTTELEPPEFGFRNHSYVQRRGAKDMDLNINAHVVDAGDDTCGGDDDDNVDIKTDTENEKSENSDDEDDYESCKEEDKDRMCYPEFASYQARFVSFCKMPDTVTQSAQSLAKAGLFYEGRNDTFKCFCCGGEIYKWNSNDDPYCKHANKYPDCSFVKDVKTQHCMDRVGITELKVDDHVSSIDDLADCLPPAYGNHSCSSIPTEKSKGHLS